MSEVVIRTVSELKPGDLIKFPLQTLLVISIEKAVYERQWKSWYNLVVINSQGKVSQPEWGGDMVVSILDHSC
jgi:hypothetical protein